MEDDWSEVFGLQRVLLEHNPGKDPLTLLKTLQPDVIHRFVTWYLHIARDFFNEARTGYAHQLGDYSGMLHGDNLLADQEADVIEQVTARIEAIDERTAALVTAGLLAGMDMFEIFQQKIEPRVEMIAWLEIVSAQETGSHLAALMFASRLTKEWVTQRDNKVRHSHAILEGVKIPVEELFSNGLAYPGDPAGDISELAGCRCSVLYRLEV